MFVQLHDSCICVLGYDRVYFDRNDQRQEVHSEFVHIRGPAFIAKDMLSHTTQKCEACIAQIAVRTNEEFINMIVIKVRNDFIMTSSNSSASNALVDNSVVPVAYTAYWDNGLVIVVGTTKGMTLVVLQCKRVDVCAVYTRLACTALPMQDESSVRDKALAALSQPTRNVLLGMSQRHLMMVQATCSVKINLTLSAVVVVHRPAVMATQANRSVKDEVALCAVRLRVY